jgi:hypothetical protein
MKEPTMARKTKARGSSRRTRKHDEPRMQPSVMRSMPRGDAGTPEREAIDELLRRNVKFANSNDAELLQIATEEARREVFANGVIARYTVPEGLCDVHIRPGGPASAPLSELSTLYRPRLYAFEKAIEWEVDEEAFSWALATERQFAREGPPESERPPKAVTFVCCGSVVTIMRAPRGRFPTPWVVADVRPADPARWAFDDQSVLLEAARRIGMNC